MNSDRYWRSAGAITVSAPALFLLIIALARLGAQSTNILLWTFFTFAPLIIIAYYLDVIIDLIKRGWLSRRHPVILVVLTWTIMYPAVWIPSNFAFSALVGANPRFKLSSVPFLAFLGAIFGIYYYIGYIYTYRVLRWINRRYGRETEPK